MKIVIPTAGQNLSAEIAPRFGRAEQFLVIDPDTMDFEVVENSQNLDLSQGAGIQAARTIAAHAPDVLITINCGPKAFKVLKAAKIKVVIGDRGRIDEAVERYKKGELSHAEEANVEGHWV
jgi:predicted Fe-Mo cluster-binding NifX family protein